jgi:hypothetical protein
MENKIDINETRTFHFGIQVQPRAKKDESGKEYYEFEISNEEIDSHNTIFRMAGAKIDSFNDDPIVTFGHPWFDTTDPDDMIGIGPAYIEGNRMLARFYPEQGDTNEKAVKVRSKLEQNLIKSASIVAYVHKYHEGRAQDGEPAGILIFDEWELIMWGIVLKGSNPKAKKRTEEKVMAMRSLLSAATEPPNSGELKSETPPANPQTEQRSTAQAELELTEMMLQIARSKSNIGNSVAKKFIHSQNH